MAASRSRQGPVLTQPNMRSPAMATSKSPGLSARNCVQNAWRDATVNEAKKASGKMAEYAAYQAST